MKGQKKAPLGMYTEKRIAEEVKDNKAAFKPMQVRHQAQGSKINSKKWN